MLERGEVRACHIPQIEIYFFSELRVGTLFFSSPSSFSFYFFTLPNPFLNRGCAPPLSFFFWSSRLRRRRSNSSEDMYFTFLKACWAHLLKPHIFNEGIFGLMVQIELFTKLLALLDNSLGGFVALATLISSDHLALRKRYL